MHLSIICSVFFLLPLAILASPIDHNLIKRTPDLEKRVDGARMTWYDVSVGLTACGGTYANSDAIVAVSSSQYASGANCGKSISITANGNTASATIVDLCPGCPDGGLDLSEGLFTQFASTDVGVLSGSWDFA